MTNNELLSAMSDLLDQKLKTELQPINAKLQIIDGRLQNVEDRLQNVEDRLQNVEGRLQNVEEDLQTVKDRLQNVENRLQNVENDLQTVKDRLQNVETTVLKTSICQENEILPRLNTIEACYTSTYNRYSSYLAKMDTAFMDIDVLKTMVTEHSKQFQKLA